MTEYEEGRADAQAGKPEATTWWGGFRSDEYRRGYRSVTEEKYRGKDKYFDMDNVGAGDEMNTRISGPSLAGFCDYFEIGASVRPGVKVPVKPGVVAKPGTPAAKPGAPKPGAAGIKQALKTGAVKPKVASKSKSKSPHKIAVVNTIEAGKGAIAAGKKAAVSAASYKPAAHAPLTKLAATLTPKGKVALGAVPVPGKKPLTSKQNKALAKHANAIARGASANKRLKAAATKATKTGTSSLAFAKTAAPFLKKKLDGPTAKTRIGGAIAIGGEFLDIDLLGEEETAEIYTTLGEMLGEGDDEIGVDASGLSPGMPGYDLSTEGGADPYGGDPYGGIDPYSQTTPTGTYGLDPSTGIVTDPNDRVLYDPSRDPSIVVVPTVENGGRGQKLTDAELKVVWQDVPDDGIVFGGSIPDGGVGSLNWYQSGTREEGGILKSAGNANGYIYTRRGTHFGSDQRSPRWMGQNGGDQVNDVNSDGSIKDVGWSDVMLTAIIPFYGMYKSPANLVAAFTGGGDSSASVVNAASIASGWGPIIGNPNGPLAGLQFAAKAGKFFWQGKACPVEWAAEADAKITQANLETIASKTTAAVVKAEQLAADIADRDEKQAKLEWDQASAQAAAEAAQQVAITQADTAQIAIDQQQAAAQGLQDIEYQKQQDAIEAQQTQADLEAGRAQSALDIERQRARLAMRQQQAEIDAELQHQMIAEAAAYNEWAAANPDQAYAAAQQVSEEGEPGVPYEPEEGVPYEPAGGGDVFEDGGQEMGEPPSMFEENMQPQVDDDFVGENWPHDEV